MPRRLLIDGKRFGRKANWFRKCRLPIRICVPRAGGHHGQVGLEKSLVPPGMAFYEVIEDHISLFQCITVVPASFGKTIHHINYTGNLPSFCSSGYSRIKDTLIIALKSSGWNLKIIISMLRNFQLHFHFFQVCSALTHGIQLYNHMCIVCICMSHDTVILHGLCVCVCDYSWMFFVGMHG